MTSGHSLSDLLIIYLYENKYLSLPKLGRFEVSDEIDLSQPEMVEFNRIPEGLITFTFNKEEGTDTELIKYITGHTRKMQSLAVADLFTLTDQVRQMLNILQPVSFSGIGTLRKEAKGGISFTPGVYRRDLLGMAKGKSPSSGFSEKPSSGSFFHMEKSHSSRSLGGILIILICLIVAIGLIYFMFSHGEKEEKGREITFDSSAVDSSSPVPDTIVRENTGAGGEKPVNREGMISYEVVFQRTDSAHAVWRVNQLEEFGHKIIVRTPDSVHYFLSVPVTSRASDTTKIKDSLQVFFGHPTTIRYNTGR